MNRLSTQIVVVIGCLILAAMVAFQLYPERILGVMNWKIAQVGGLSKKSVQVEDYEIHYLAGGEGNGSTVNPGDKIPTESVG